MTDSRDPTEAIRRQAAKFPGVDKDAACNQSAFKVGKRSFLFLGPGQKGIGFKAMFKLKDSIPEAMQLAGKHPERFDVGTTGWVTARFTAQDPLPKQIWEKWLAESYGVTCGTGQPTRKRNQ